MFYHISFILDNIARLPAAMNTAETLETRQSLSSDIVFPTTTDDTPEGCLFKNKNYRLHERIEDGCERICFCRETGQLECAPRCPEITKKSDRCVVVKDTEDACCEKQLCDVSLDDHEETGFVPLNEEEKSLKKLECTFKGRNYSLNDQFHDECKAFCFCDTDGVHCSKIECPSTFGLDVVDPSCEFWVFFHQLLDGFQSIHYFSTAGVKWAPEPATFRAIAPKCCPERMKCKRKNRVRSEKSQNHLRTFELTYKYFANSFEYRCQQWLV